MKKADITYATDGVVEQYAKDITTAHTLPALIMVVNEWRWCAVDALEVAHGMTDKDFDEWRKGLKLERSRRFAGEAFSEKYGRLLMPAYMFETAMLAHHYKVPWGLAYMRRKEQEETK